MTKRDLEKLLKQAGFEKLRESRHEIWFKDGLPRIPIPRHKGDIPKGTANNILKKAGIK